MGPHSSIGGAHQIQLRLLGGWRGLFRGLSGARGGASLTPPEGASNSLAPALGRYTAQIELYSVLRLYRFSLLNFFQHGSIVQWV